MKVRAAVVVLSVLVLIALVMPASASVRDVVTAKPTAQHPNGWVKWAPVDQAELDASRKAGPGSAQVVVPAGSDGWAESAAEGGRRVVRAAPAGGLRLARLRPPYPPAPYSLLV